MVFTSRFGEYKAKDEVLKYLIKLKKQVVMASKSLKTIVVKG